MSNADLAITLQQEHEEIFDNTVSDIELMKMATNYALTDFDVSTKDANSIGREVLKLYEEVE